MALEWFMPDGDGTSLGGWTSEGTAPHADSIDDYGTTGAGSADDDTTYALGPNVVDGTYHATLDASPSTFDGAGVGIVSIKAKARTESAGVSGTADTIGLYFQIVKSDESTAMTSEATFSTNLGTTYVESTITAPLVGAFTKTDWDGAKLRIRQDYTVQGCADTTCRARVTAVGVAVDWSPSELITAAVGLITVP